MVSGVGGPWPEKLRRRTHGCRFRSLRSLQWHMAPWRVGHMSGTGVAGKIGSGNGRVVGPRRRSENVMRKKLLVGGSRTSTGTEGGFWSNRGNSRLYKGNNRGNITPNRSAITSI